MEQVSGKSLNEYIREYFLTPLGLTELKLLPQDTTDYTKLTHPHAYPNTFMGLAGDGVNPIDIEDVIANATKLLAECRWYCRDC